MKHPRFELISGAKIGMPINFEARPAITKINPINTKVPVARFIKPPLFSYPLNSFYAPKQIKSIKNPTPLVIAKRVGLNA